jgi:hypothetical protein
VFRIRTFLVVSKRLGQDLAANPDPWLQKLTFNANPDADFNANPTWLCKN